MFPGCPATKYVFLCRMVSLKEEKNIIHLTSGYVKLFGSIGHLGFQIHTKIEN
jgi:hypothetical protein